MTENTNTDAAEERLENGSQSPASETTEQPSEPEPYPQLRTACLHTNLEQIYSIVRDNPGIDLNKKDSDQDSTPFLDFIWSAVEDEDAKDAPECARFLISQGADVNVKKGNGWSVLHRCARWNNDVSLAVAKVLLELGADPNANQRLPAKTGPENGGNDGHDHEKHEDGCECGQQIGAVLDAVHKEVTGEQLDLEEQTEELDVTALHHACGHGDNFPMVKLLIENGAKIDVDDYVAGTPLRVAVDNEREETCALLLSKPGGTACLGIRDRHGRFPIHYAVDRRRKAIVAMLIEAGALVDATVEGDKARDNQKGLTPLHLACKDARCDGMLEIIEYLLEHGADVTKLADQGQSPLLLSVLEGSVEAAKILVKHGADVKAAVGKFDDVDALHVAGTAGAGELCRWLVEEAGLAVDKKDNQGYTALIHAAGYGRSAEAIRILVSSLGADIESPIYDGRRPLHFAAFKGRPECAKELISLGADKEATDDSGWTPLHFAARYHHEETLQVLLDSGAEIGKKIDGGPQPKLVNGDEIDICGFTAVDLARITRGGQGCVDILVAAGEELCDATKDLQDDDLFKEEGGKCCVM